MNIRCRRCGRPLTHSKSIERGYGPVCWKKIELELWLGDAAIPDLHAPKLLTRGKARTPQLVEPLIASQRTLDEFFFEIVEPRLTKIPTPRVILVEG